MKKVIILISILLGFISYSQKKEAKDTLPYERYKIEAGVVMPLGNLKKTIGVSQSYGFWYRTRVEHNDLLDLGLTIVVPTIKESFVYQGKDSLFNVKAKAVTVMASLRMNKIYPVRFLRQKANFEWSSSVGGSFYSFEDKENPEDESGYYEEEDGTIVYRIDTNTKALSCIYMGQGIGFTSKKVGVQVVYNFTPYHWFTKRIENDFGTSALSVTMSFKM